MSVKLKIALLIFSLVWFLVIFYLIRKDKLPVKYSLFWFIAILVIFLIAIIPSILELVTSVFGFKTLSNLVIGVILTLLLFITLILTTIVAIQKKQITLLIQEVSLIKSEKEINNYAKK